jgi:hypothetical protein
MAIRLEDTYPASRITPADANYPAGSLKNETTPGVSNDGTPLDKLWGDDFEGLKQWLLDQAGVTASGVPDNINASDLGDALNALFAKGIRTTVFTSGGVYSPPSDVKALEIIAIGAGGGGGGVDGQGAGTQAASCPGAGGGWSRQLVSSIEPAYTIVIGAGGPGGASGDNAGINGGNTTVTSTSVNLVANGGPGGPGDTATATNSIGVGRVGGTSSGGDINGSGEGTSVYGASNGTLLAGTSGGSLFGGSVFCNLSADGADATTSGAGGGATAVFNSATDYAGGDGEDGGLDY